MAHRSVVCTIGLIELATKYNLSHKTLARRVNRSWHNKTGVPFPQPVDTFGNDHLYPRAAACLWVEAYILELPGAA